MVIRVMPRSENTGFVNKRTRKVRKNYNLFLSLDWGYADNVIAFNYRKVKELSELLCLKLKETFFNEIKHIELGVATVHITTFKREDKEKILKMIRNNLIITSKEVLNEKYEKKKVKRIIDPLNQSFEITIIQLSALSAFSAFLKQKGLGFFYYSFFLLLEK